MSRDHRNYYDRDSSGREWSRPDYRSRNEMDKRRSRTPRKNDKDSIDDNILSEISKLPEPSELWDSQIRDNNFSTSSFHHEGNQAFNSNYQPSYSGIYDDFPSSSSVQPIGHPPGDMSSWNQMSLPPPVAPPAPVINSEDLIKKEAAIESEMRHQKAALSKQREDYIKKATILKKELDTLKDQRNELRGDVKRSPSPDTKKFLKENTKLQLEIQNKLKTITNVVDMLNGIIGEEAHIDLSNTESSPDRGSKKKPSSPSGKKFNYVYYDPEMHWCRVCNEFPETAKSYLNHLHSPAHQKMAAAHMEAPWHSINGMNEGYTNHPNAPNKRTPIRGLQFFVPSTAWYCKLCDQFIGDLHCASAHLKSVNHSKNYTNFVEQNPHWETDWMSDRQKAFEKSRTNKVKVERQEEKPQYTAHKITFNKDGFHTKQEVPAELSESKKKKKEKKKKSKRRQSTSSSSSAVSSSDSEPVKKKKKKHKKAKSGSVEDDDKVLNEWMSSINVEKLNESDRNLLDTLKSRMKVETLKEENSPSPKSREREPSISDPKRRLRESERQEPRDEREFRDSRDRFGGSRRDDRRDDSRGDRRDDSRGDRRDDSRGDRRDDRRSDRRNLYRGSRSSPPRPDTNASSRTDTKKPDFKKMPFIGKMPLYKHLGKNPKDDLKKDDDKKRVVDVEKKKAEDEITKKKQEEIDAEIQRKVAEFKEKIAKAQEERQQQMELVPPTLALPTSLPFIQHHPHGAMGPQPNLPKDFQDALDIIFPTEVGKGELNAPELFAPFPLGGVMPTFPPMGIMQPQMFGFDMNAQLFQPQLYEPHVPPQPQQVPQQQQVPQPQQQQVQQPQQNKNRKNGKKVRNVAVASAARKAEEQVSAEKVSARKKEELDELALLGIDASDVGAGI